MIFLKNFLLKRNNILYFAWLVAFVATIGSLYFSEVLGIQPCILCWYQRILIYPLVIIIAVGIIRKDTKIYYYVLPMSLIGLAIALFHYLLAMKVVPEGQGVCSVLDISCAIQQIEWLGFINIPFLSLCAFALITILMLVYKKKFFQKQKE